MRSCHDDIKYRMTLNIIFSVASTGRYKRGDGLQLLIGLLRANQEPVYLDGYVLWVLWLKANIVATLNLV